ncbi:hypothetical protein H0H87_005073 [Tephrocybe sp. NHM501043]|nr:hypothetical protein H0H87_005073 [Tephrocybe sp. NHM501043]
MTVQLTSPTDFLNAQYYTEISLGIPAQTIEQLVGSQHPVRLDGLLPSQQYDASLSSSYKVNGSSFSTKYGSGSMEGFVSRGTLSIGDLTIKDQLCLKVQDACMSALTGMDINLPGGSLSVYLT